MDFRWLQPAAFSLLGLATPARQLLEEAVPVSSPLPDQALQVAPTSTFSLHFPSDVNPAFLASQAAVGGPFWILGAVKDSGGGAGGRGIRKAVRGWRYAIGDAILRELKWQHTRFSPTSGLVHAVALGVHFHPVSGRVRKVEAATTGEPPVVGRDEAVVNVTYAFQTREIFVEGRRTSRFFGRIRKERGPEGQRVEVLSVPDPGQATGRAVIHFGPSEVSSLSPKAERILEGIHGRSPLFPQAKVKRKMIRGVEVIELPSRLYEENTEYARVALRALSESRVTIAWHPGEPIPLMDLWASVAKNGHFVGFAYAMPEENSPRRTIYEVGMPSLGTWAKIHYAVYKDPRSSQSLRVPLGFKWERPPSDIQRAAIEGWAERTEFTTAQRTWIKTEESRKD